MSQNAPRTFAVVATVEDPLSAERLVEMLTASGFDAFERARGGATADAFGSLSQSYWEVLVQADAYEKAAAAAKAELEAIAADADDNAKAAEEEALSGENPVDP